METIAFRCRRSGNVVSFSNENDIAGLRKHEGYEEVSDGLQVKEQEAPKEEVVQSQVIMKKRGRPAKGK